MNGYLELGLHAKIAFPLFSERVFAKKGVKNACLALREKYKLNTNIVLFCCWLASQNYVNITEQDIQNILEKITPWHERIVKGLRLMRSARSSPAKSLSA